VRSGPGCRGRGRRVLRRRRWVAVPELVLQLRNLLLLVMHLLLQCLDRVHHGALLVHRRTALFVHLCKCIPHRVQLLHQFVVLLCSRRCSRRCSRLVTWVELVVVAIALSLGSQRHVHGDLLVALAVSACMLDGSLILVVMLACGVVVGRGRCSGRWVGLGWRRPSSLGVASSRIHIRAWACFWLAMERRLGRIHGRGCGRRSSRAKCRLRGIV
jgi:hypothetical protein